MPQSFASYAFGCRVNQAEKEALDNQLIERGYAYSESQPDIYLINTCSVTHKAEREARQKINQIKRQFPDTKIIVTGCAATNWLKREINPPPVDHIIDNASKEYIADILEKRTKKSVRNKSSVSKLVSKPDKYLNSGRLLLKIQDGCHRYCSYCIVPYLRGLPQSVPIASLLSQINQRKDGLKEVILAAINTEAYGYDTAESCIDLIQSVLDKTYVNRLSFGSIHPWTLTEEFIRHYNDWFLDDRFVDFFHIPLQSGSNKMLRLMKRNYTREEFMDKLDRINKVNPFAFIGTDVIVGFLDESDKDFEDTYTFLDQTPIDKFHVFRYSERQHTAASYLGKRLPQPTAEQKKQRSQAVISLGKKKYATFIDKHVGKTFQTLLLDKTDDGFRMGLLQNQIPVLIPPGKHRASEIVAVSITHRKGSRLIGKVLS